VKTNYEQRHTSSADATRKATTALFHPTPPPPSTPTTADKPPAVPHSRRGGGGGGSPRRVPASQTARACAAGGGAAANASGSKRTKVGARIKVEGEAAAELGRAGQRPREWQRGLATTSVSGGGGSAGGGTVETATTARSWRPVGLAACCRRRRGVGRAVWAAIPASCRPAAALPAHPAAVPGPSMGTAGTTQMGRAACRRAPSGRARCG